MLGVLVLPIQAADDGDLAVALEAVRAHRLPFTWFGFAAATTAV
jgi:hypothetical protein